jgi:hypothetical protein
MRQRAQGILPYEIEEVDGESTITSYAGLPLVAEAYRATRAAEAVRRFVKTKRRLRHRELSDEEMVESFCVLLAGGGECNDDFGFMGSDSGLKEMLGHELPSPTRAKQFLYGFHRDETEKAVAEQRSLMPSFVPEESGPLAGLQEAVRATASAMQKHRPVREATIDLDATIIVSEKREAAKTYEGERGYQPVTAYWVEKELILADQFRDGNVPARSDLLGVAKRAVAALPNGMKRIYIRSDSAGYEHKLMNWCREERPDRPPITFAISAVMSRELRRAIQALPDEAWRELDQKGNKVRSWAEVEFIPSKPSVKKGRPPDRYLAIRVVPKQGELFSDGERVKYFAVVTNDWERDGKEIIEWHRQKAGTIEKVHDVLKNDLGAGVMPCGRFGANAAWFRMNVLTFNLLSVVRQTALPKELEKAQPKRLRFRVFCVAGEVIHHARKLVVRVVGELFGREGLLVRARRLLRRLERRLLRFRLPFPAPT